MDKLQVEKETLVETPEEIEAKKQFWREWGEQAKKESPARRKLMEDSMAAFLKSYPEYDPKESV